MRDPVDDQHPVLEISVPATTVSTGDFTLLRDEDSLLGGHEVSPKNISLETQYKAKSICMFRVSRPCLVFCLPDLYHIVPLSLKD